MSTPSRPLLFSSVLTLSTIGSSIACLAFLFTAIFYSNMLPTIQKLTNIETPGLLGRWYVLTFALVHFVSLSGIIKLWHNRKSGFYIYLAAQITLLVLPLIYLGKNAFSSTNAIFTILFIGIYLVFLKRLK
ncbi:MAG: hypothetical protein ACK5JD_02075 [Mangrovibacterium sp.]